MLCPHIVHYHILYYIMEKHDINFPAENSNIISIREIRNQENDNSSTTSREIFTQSLENQSETHNDINTPRTSVKIMDDKIIDDTLFNIGQTSAPLVFNKHFPINNQSLRISSNLPSPTSLNLQSTNQPQSLFLQALAIFNESTLSLAVTDKKVDNPHLILKVTKKINSTEITPSDSLTSAPPSYSFVLRQIASRRRPRLMGTFIPSPSFVQHTPPPNYATAFDIYVDNPLPPPSTRVYNFGFTPIPIVCPECGYTGMTIVASKITLCTHLCAVILCLLCCWICAPLPYVLRSCKDVYHYCRNCRNFLGMYCPTNPESAYT